MRVYGLDFTSSPTAKKPITCAEGTFNNGVLTLESFGALYSFAEFENLLGSDGPWISGLDFPFGQPWKLISDLALSNAWAEYVAYIKRGGKGGFKTLVEEYKRDRQPGDKEHLRVTDALADSRSPMKLYGIPVGKMFFEGAPRLLDANVSVIPCRELKGTSRVAIEAYPALVARRFSSTGYKNDDPRKQTAEHEAARRDIVEGIRWDLQGEFGFAVKLGDEHAGEMIRDAGGDTLDAVLCAIQAAWAYSKKSKRYGVPAANHPVIQSEGWIVDPVILKGRNSSQENRP